MQSQRLDSKLVLHWAWHACIAPCSERDAYMATPLLCAVLPRTAVLLCCAMLCYAVSPVQLATAFSHPLVACAALEAALRAPCDSDESPAASMHAASRQQMARTVAEACQVAANCPLLAKAAAAAACAPPPLCCCLVIRGQVQQLLPYTTTCLLCW
jgi:hypothetical protein